MTKSLTELDRPIPSRKKILTIDKYNSTFALKHLVNFILITITSLIRVVVIFLKKWLIKEL
jgi:hypothetical protein